MKEREESFKAAEEDFHKLVAQHQANDKKDAEALKAQVEENVAKKTSNDPGIEDEVTCVICCDLFYDAYTLSCSHIFCGPCIEQWSHVKKSCPTCTHPLCAMPIPARSINALTEKFVASLPDDQKAAYNNRVASIREKENTAYRSLNAMITQANARRSRFLAVDQRWTQQEKGIFKSGIRYFSLFPFPLWV